MMVKDGLYFVVPLLILATLSIYLGWIWMAAVFLLPAAFVAFFFRNPERALPSDPNAIVSPADGKVVQVKNLDEGTLVSIFLSIFDVHVNRAPIEGTVTRLEHRPGKFLLAWDERASVENEQLVWTISGDRNLTFKLIAGLVARRIVPWVKLADVVSRGDRIGLIRFGSRVDVLFPEGVVLEVQEGDRVRGGSSILGYWGDET